MTDESTSESKGAYDPSKTLDVSGVRSMEARPFHQSLPCPAEDCKGDLRSNGLQKPAGPGNSTMLHQHKCSACEYEGFVAGETFPRVSFRRLQMEQETPDAGNPDNEKTA